MERLSDLRMSFDEFVRDVNSSHDSLGDTIKNAEDMKDLLQRSGYPELAGRMSEVVDGVRQISDVIDTFRKMYSQGRLRYGPRLPVNVWERRTIREESPMLSQERPRDWRPTRKKDV